MRKSATNDDVLSTREAAERLGVALRTVQLWVEGGVLPAELAYLQGARELEKTVRQRRLAMVDVRDDREVADEASVHSLKETGFRAFRPETRFPRRPCLPTGNPVSSSSVPVAGNPGSYL